MEIPPEIGTKLLCDCTDEIEKLRLEYENEIRKLRGQVVLLKIEKELLQDIAEGKSEADKEIDAYFSGRTGR